MLSAFASQAFANKTQSQVLIFPSSLMNSAPTTLSRRSQTISRDAMTQISGISLIGTGISKMWGETPNYVFQLAYRIQFFKNEASVKWT